MYNVLGHLQDRDFCYQFTTDNMDTVALFTCIEMKYNKDATENLRNYEAYAQSAYFVNIPDATLWCLVGWVNDWLPSSSMVNSIQSITSIASNQCRSIFMTTVIILTVCELSVAMHWSSW